MKSLRADFLPAEQLNVISEIWNRLADGQLPKCPCETTQWPRHCPVVDAVAALSVAVHQHMQVSKIISLLELIKDEGLNQSANE